MTARAGCLALVALAGCGQLLGIDDFSGRDGGPPDAIPGPTLRISGVVRGSFGGGPASPVVAAQLEFYRLPQGTRVASAVSTPAGTYSLDVPTIAGMALEGYVRAQAPDGRLYRTFYYLRLPATPATQLDIDMVDGVFFEQIASLFGDTHGPNASAAFLQVVNPIGVPVPGVPVQIDPPQLKVRYNDQNGNPSPIATATGPDGLAFVFNAPLGEKITVTGLTPGITFGPVTTPPTEPASVYFITLRSMN